jgi:hypothetical protein
MIAVALVAIIIGIWQANERRKDRAIPEAQLECLRRAIASYGRPAPLFTR